MVKVPAAETDEVASALRVTVTTPSKIAGPSWAVSEAVMVPVTVPATLANDPLVTRAVTPRNEASPLTLPFQLSASVYSIDAVRL